MADVKSSASVLVPDGRRLMEEGLHVGLDASPSSAPSLIATGPITMHVD